MRITRRKTNPEDFRKFTDEEMEIAKNTDLPDLLEHLGYSLKRLGRYYTTREMDSIRISSRQSPLHGKRPDGHSPLRSLASPLPTKPEGRLCGGPNYWTWRRYSNDTGGDAITFLQEFEGKSFREAVEYLLDFNGRARDSPRLRRPVMEEEKPEFVLPPANEDNRRVFAYLRKRGIAPQVIRSFLNAGLLYEDAKYHNCVFVGRDSTGQPRFASKRGTYDKDGVSFKRDVLGSDKSIAFPIPCNPAVPWVLVFEAPIDLMSFCTICEKIISVTRTVRLVNDRPYGVYVCRSTEKLDPDDVDFLKRYAMRAGTRKAVSLDGLPDFCSLEEVSKVFRVSRATAYRMAERGNIPCLRIGRRMIVPKEHLVRWVDQSVSCENDMGGE